MKKIVFEQQLDKKKIANSFKASGSTYDDNALVQRGIGARLLNLLGQYGSGPFARVLEIGCGTGSLTEELCRRWQVDTIHLNDIVPEFCKRTDNRVAAMAGWINSVPGDIEQLNIPEALDLIISSATLQWVGNLPGVMFRLSHALRPDGLLALSILGPGTMTELNSITGQGLKYHRMENIRAMLPETMQLLHLENESQQLWFARGRDVLRHIRLTGVGGVGSGNPLRIGLKDFERRYQERFGEAKGIPVSYITTYLIARKGGK